MMFTELQKPREEWYLEAECFREYLILGHDRISQIYDDAMYKLVNSNFTVLDLSNNHITEYWDYLFNIIRRNPHNIKLKKLVLHTTSLADLKQLHDIQDLFDDCTLHLPNKGCYNRYQGVITGVAFVIILGDKFKERNVQRIFQDNNGKPASV